MAGALRTFVDHPAVRERTPLLGGLTGPSGSGKTYSALRLATGIQRVSGGDIWCIDTEARRALHYADQFKFRHVEFKAPFGPMDYLAAIEHCQKKGAGIIIVDSTSHEHEGPGGVLEMHVAEQERLSKAWGISMDKATMAAWQKPKSERRRLLNSILQMPINFIFCFRAKEKVKLDRGGKPIPMGWMPIAGEEFVYEMTFNVLLYPSGGGVPVWQPEESGEKAIIKLPSQFRDIFADRKPLSEEIGQQLAQWAAGSTVSTSPPSRTASSDGESGAAAHSPAAPGLQDSRPHTTEAARVTESRDGNAGSLPPEAPREEIDYSKDPAPEPCAVCHKPLVLRKAGKAQGSGNPYAAFWGCPAKCKGKGTSIVAKDWHAAMSPPDEFITGAEVTALLQLAVLNGWNDNTLAELLKRKGIAGVREIPSSRHDEIMKEIERGYTPF